MSEAGRTSLWLGTVVEESEACRSMTATPRSAASAMSGSALRSAGLQVICNTSMRSVCRVCRTS